MSNTRTVTSEPGPLRRSLRPLLVSLCVGIAVCVGLLLLFSVVIATQSIPQSIISPMAVFSVSVGSFAAGFICAKIKKESGLLWGAIVGGILCFVVLFSSFAVSDNGFGLLAVTKVIFILFSAMLGGVLGVNYRPRRK
ncbi:TIGR04086 family membrane protein [Oscillospiraceae bacterium MB08-C2-2]|nr:TIGR04086 family membrane protein [Oscillospiraceae bacterium MB08-C2-2]